MLAPEKRDGHTIVMGYPQKAVHGLLAKVFRADVVALGRGFDQPHDGRLKCNFDCIAQSDSYGRLEKRYIPA
jgi:hypothetical protein